MNPTDTPDTSLLMGLCPGCGREVWPEDWSGLYQADPTQDTWEPICYDCHEEPSVHLL